MAKIALERVLRASLEEVWAMWTTPAGIESWWGPEGFEVTVLSQDLRVGGHLRYAMTAVQPELVAFMAQQGMPPTTISLITYTRVEAPRRLEYTHLADFIPGVSPYDVETVVSLEAVAGGVRLQLAFDPMHDPLWTERAVQGWTSELGKLERVLAARLGGAA